MIRTKYYILFILLLPVVFQTTKAQSDTLNYVSKKTYTESTSNNALQTIQYFDGLGRPIQTVETAPGLKSLITRTDYDNLGRESKQYLPGTNGSSTSGDYRPNYSSNSFYGDSCSYSETIYENSPLNRVKNQYGPGNDWRTASQRVQTEYLANTISGVLACYNYSLVTYNSFKNNGYYSANQLYVTKVTDEENNVSYEFTDKSGRLLLQRQVISSNEWADTYYIYNDFGNIVFVLPPEASKEFVSSNQTYEFWSNSYLNLMCHFYQYDERQLLQGKVTSGSMHYYALDKAGRIVMEQTYDAPSEDMSRGFKFFKYDKLGRQIMSGIYTGYDNKGLDINQRLADARSKVRNSLITEERSSTENNYFYTWGSFPTNKNEVIVTSINYYDSYTSLTVPAGLAYSAESGYGEKCDSVKSLLTSTRHACMNGTGVSGEIITFYYYDKKGNLIQQRSTNHLNGTDVIYYAYNYNNQVIKKHIDHTSSTGYTIAETYDYLYDAAKRPKETTYSISSTKGSTRSLSNLKILYTYDDLGRLKKIEYPANTNNVVNYTYNLRGWFTKIQSNLLKEDIYYNTSPKGSTGKKYYNGNIAAVRFTTPEKTNYGHEFTYNPLGFMTKAVYGEDSDLSSSANRYNEEFSYDRNGNIESLKRYASISNAAQVVDQLSMTYTSGSNRISTITDACTNQNSASIMEFRKGSVSSNQYAYYPDGKLQRDFHRNICRIDYNPLALPELVIFRYGHYIEYLYDAAGNKLQTKHYQSQNNMNLGYHYNEPAPSLTNPIVTTTNYIQNKVFVNGIPRQVLTEFGYVDVSSSAFQIVSYLKDHLGNNRVAINRSGTKLHENHSISKCARMKKFFTEERYTKRLTILRAPRCGTAGRCGSSQTRN